MHLLSRESTNGVYMHGPVYGTHKVYDPRACLEVCSRQALIEGGKQFALENPVLCLRLHGMNLLQRVYIDEAWRLVLSCREIESIRPEYLPQFHLPEPAHMPLTLCRDGLTRGLTYRIILCLHV